MKKAINILFFIGLTFSTNIFAAKYNIEIIVFKQLNSHENIQEDLSYNENLDQEKISKALDIFKHNNSNTFTDEINPLVFASTNSNQLPSLITQKNSKLEEQRENLINQGFPILLHTAWSDNLGDKNKAKTIRIKSGNEFSDEYFFLGEKKEFSNETLQSVFELDGTITAYINTFLFLDLDLVLRKEGQKKQNSFSNNTNQILLSQISPNLEEEEIPYLYAFSLKERRRFRSGELHFFDHPLFGVVALITPAEK